MGVPPNHPFYGIFHYKLSFWGTPIYGNPHVYSCGLALSLEHFLGIGSKNGKIPHAQFTLGLRCSGNPGHQTMAERRQVVTPHDCWLILDLNDLLYSLQEFQECDLGFIPFSSHLHSSLCSSSKIFMWAHHHSPAYHVLGCTHKFSICRLDPNICQALWMKCHAFVASSPTCSGCSGQFVALLEV